MTLEEALDEAMRQFMSGEGNPEMDKLSPSKFNLKYFDRLSEQLNPSKKESNMDKLKKRMAK